MSGPSNPVDVAEYIIQRSGNRPSAKKVQKLAFYAHAIHRAQHGESLVSGGFQAWEHGPVSPAIYDRQRGDYAPSTVFGNPDSLSQDAKASIELACELYGDRSEHELVTLSHGDGPWTLARGAIPASAPSRERISDETIDAVLVPTVRKLLDAYQGRSMTLDAFRTEFAS